MRKVIVGLATVGLLVAARRVSHELSEHSKQMKAQCEQMKVHCEEMMASKRSAGLAGKDEAPAGSAARPTT
jgi:hypothetical protein